MNSCGTACVIHLIPDHDAINLGRQTNGRFVLSLYSNGFNPCELSLIKQFDRELTNKFFNISEWVHFVHIYERKSKVKVDHIPH